MLTTKTLKMSSFPILVASLTALSGCANYEVNTTRGNIPGHYIRYEMQEADRAIEAARKAGKDKTCPAEFKAAEDAKIKAYDVFRACHTEEGAALAKQATEKANALCPPQSVKVALPVLAPAPVIPAPVDNLTATPPSITKGESATLTWSSKNASKCNITPTVGAVKPQGSIAVTPFEDTNYTLVCNGEGGSATSSATVAVASAAPIVVAAPSVPAKLCAQTVLNIRFDTNKANIKSQYVPELKKLADFLKEFPDSVGTISGHTDADGSMKSNMKLSQKRAESVRNYLVKNFGIAPGRIVAKGYGPTKPVASNKNRAGKEQNRRIETNFTCDKK